MNVIRELADSEPKQNPDAPKKFSKKKKSKE